MTLYYTLVFMILMAEMGMFMFIIIPFPFKVRQKIFTFISDNPLVAKLQYGMKICFIFILILFIDSVNRVYRVQLELAAYSDASGQHAPHVVGHERTEVQARRFYSERNMYLCGFTLFLSLILNRTYTMINDILALEERVKAVDTHKAAAAKSGGEVSNLRSEIEDLKAEVQVKNKQVQAMKSQAEGLHREYDSLSERYQQAIGDTGAGKKDD